MGKYCKMRTWLRRASAYAREKASRLGRASIWHPLSLPEEDHKYRMLKRVWLPIYDLLALTAGIFAITFGSRLLNRTIGADAVPLVGAVFAGIAVACLFGIAFPRLWRVEMAAKVILVGMIASYSAAILLFPAPSLPSEEEPPNFFIASMLLSTLPLPLFRLGLLGEEYKERRTEESS